MSSLILDHLMWEIPKWRWKLLESVLVTWAKIQDHQVVLKGRYTRLEKFTGGNRQYSVQEIRYSIKIVLRFTQVLSL